MARSSRLTAEPCRKILLESELFGYVKGAFTGANANKSGLLRAANGGTLFLDEVGEMPASLQVKLLRALQEREVTPLGATEPISFDARIIAATNRSLDSEVTENRFREDLFYRLSVISFTVPALRDRREDIPLLARFFIKKFSQESGIIEKRISDEAMQKLINYHWRGNVRELQNAIERGVTLSDEQIELSHLPNNIIEREYRHERFNRTRDYTGRIGTPLHFGNDGRRRRRQNAHG